MDLDLQQIPAAYRPMPFWSWNDRLEPAELCRQIGEMHRAGLGGFFMHARGGLQTPYLSAEWLHCIEVCIAEADRYGMQAWLYDENGWPSGFGGGLVNGKGLKYQEKYLRYEYLDDVTAAHGNTIAVYDAGSLAFLGRELPEKTARKLLHCYYEVNPWYVDNLDAEVVAEFIRVTHQHYYDALKPELRDKLCGVFTDEPQLSRNGLLWSFVLEREYRRTYGRELLPELPGLFLETPESSARRVRFWTLVADLFSRSYLKQIREWCDARGWLLTGHHVLEECFRRQINPNGAVMPQYRYFHIPGVDNLGRFPASPAAAVQLASTAAQCGQKRLMTESFASTGWACSFTDMRWIYLPQLARGINFLCPHLAAYSLRGLRKRDYPASSFYHQPWWPDYRHFTDSAARVGMILANGRSEVEVLVIHPISSVWKNFTGVEQGAVLDAYNQALEDLTAALDARQLEHHYADEIIFAAAGSVKNGRIHVGEASYRLVIVPQLSNLSGAIAAALQEFQAQGGEILTVTNRCENTPLTLDGVAAPAEFTAWFRSLPAFASEAEAAAAAAALLPGNRKITQEGKPAADILSTVRQVTLHGRSGKFYYLVNRNRHRAVRVQLELPASAAEANLLDTGTGELRRLTGLERQNGFFRFACTLAAAGDAAFFIADGSGLPETAADRTPDAAPVQTLSAYFTVKSHSGNLLTLDNCTCRFPDGTVKTGSAVDLQTHLLKCRYCGPLELEFAFDCDADFDFQRPPALAVETPELFRFALNGVSFPAQETGYLFDRAFHLLSLPAVCRPGRNLLTLTLDYRQPETVYPAIEAAGKFEAEANKLGFETELESIYLYGDFTVRHRGRTETLERGAVRYCGNFALGAPLTGQRVNAADLTAAGMPFFCGTVTLEQTFKLTETECRRCQQLQAALSGANSGKIAVNGRDPGGRYWEPWRWDLADGLKPGENTLEVTLTTSLRNMLGPHHLECGESYGVGPDAFLQEPGILGKMPPPGNPGYCLVKFGLEKPELTGQ